MICVFMRESSFCWEVVITRILLTVAAVYHIAPNWALGLLVTQKVLQ